MIEEITGLVRCTDLVAQTEKERDLYKHAFQVNSFPPTSPAALGEVVPFLAQYWAPESAAGLIQKAGRAGALCFLLSFATSRLKEGPKLAGEKSDGELESRNPTSVALLRSAPDYIAGDFGKEKQLGELIQSWLQSELTEVRLVGLRSLAKCKDTSLEVWSKAGEDPAETIRLEAVRCLLKKCEHEEPDRETLTSTWRILDRPWRTNSQDLWDVRWKIVEKVSSLQERAASLETVDEKRLESITDAIGIDLSLRYASLMRWLLLEKDEEIAARQLVKIPDMVRSVIPVPPLMVLLRQSLTDKLIRLEGPQLGKLKHHVKPALQQVCGAWAVLLSERSVKIRRQSLKSLAGLVHFAVTISADRQGIQQAFVELISTSLLDPVHDIRVNAVDELIRAVPFLSLPDDLLKLVVTACRSETKNFPLCDPVLDLVGRLEVRSVSQFSLLYQALSDNNQPRRQRALQELVRNNKTYLAVYLPLKRVRDPDLRVKLGLDTEGSQQSRLPTGESPKLMYWASRKRTRQVLIPDGDVTF